jgi:hypothetical protein
LWTQKEFDGRLELDAHLSERVSRGNAVAFFELAERLSLDIDLVTQLLKSHPAEVTGLL